LETIASEAASLGLLPHLQLSPIWEQEEQEALAVQQGRDIVSNQSMPVANESGASIQRWRTSASILNHEL